jgi:hypothetical protein
MSLLRDLLSRYSVEIEMRMKLQLDAIVRGSLVRSQLPQSWNFKTEQEAAFFSVSKDGKTSIGDGLVPNPDVTIEWKHDFLCTVLKNRSIEGIPPGEEPVVTVHTMKGRIGYAMIRRSLGFS